MPTLSSALVKLQVATMADVEEALARQVLYGGDLSTNLLEASAVSEEQLAGVLAQCLNLEPAPVGELPRPEESTLRLVPADLVTRHSVYPIQQSHTELVLAVTDALPEDVEADLSFALGLNVLQRTAPLVRVRQAISRDYGVPLEQRLQRLVAKLEGRLELPSRRPAADRSNAGTLSLPRPASFPPAALPSEVPNRLGAPVPAPGRLPPELSGTHPPHVPVEAVSTAAAPAGIPNAGAGHSTSRERAHTLPSARFTPPLGFEFPPVKKSGVTELAPGAPTLPGPFPAADRAKDEAEQPSRRESATPDATSLPARGSGDHVRTGAAPKGPLPLPPGKPRRGPYALATAEKDLHAAASRDEVMAALVHFVGQYFDYLVLFVVSGDQAKARDALGNGPRWEEIHEFAVDLAEPSMLRLARESGTHVLHVVASTGEDGNLLRALRRPLGKQSLALPIVVRGRCVLLLYGDHGAEDVELSPLADVLTLVPQVAAAFERVILRRKGGETARPAQLSMEPPDPSAGPAHRRKSSLPGREQRAQALAKALGGTSAPASPSASAAEPRGATQQRLSQEVIAAPPPAIKGLDPTAVPEGSPGFAPITRQVRALGEDAPTEDETPIVVPSIRASWTVPIAQLDPGEPLFPLTRRASLTGTAAAIAAAFAPSPEPTREPPPATPGRQGALAQEAAPPAAEPDNDPVTLRRAPSETTLAALFLDAPSTVLRAVMGAAAPSLAIPLQGVPQPPIPPESAIAPAPPVARADSAVDEEDSAPSIELLSEPPSSRVQSASPPPVSVSEESPELVLGALGMEDAWEEGVVSEDGKAPLAPATRTVRIGARRLPAPQSADELGLPSVIIDVAVDARTLVELIAGGDESATEQLKDMGEAGVAALVARFPGPITNEPRPGTAALRPSRCGPILHALVRLGRPAVPYLVARTSDPDVSVRSWATRLLGEIPSPDGAEAIAQRFADEEEVVRRAALAGARLLENNQPARNALRNALLRNATDRVHPARSRYSALEALADLRDPASIVPLIELLGENGSDVPKFAHQALVVTSRQDFGMHAGTWLGWWEKNGNRHRIEWLIDALVHESGDIRRAAGDELKSTTKEYFGYYDDLPKKERQRAQSRYRDWWETRGRILFS